MRMRIARSVVIMTKVNVFYGKPIGIVVSPLNHLTVGVFLLDYLIGMSLTRQITRSPSHDDR